MDIEILLHVFGTTPQFSVEEYIISYKNLNC